MGKLIYHQKCDFLVEFGQKLNRLGNLLPQCIFFS